MTFLEAMKLAVELYRIGEPVVLKDQSGNVLHGQETLSTITDLKKCRVISDIDAETWKVSHWPQVLEGARQGWLRNQTG